jgi:hypothetical protein
MDEVFIVKSSILWVESRSDGRVESDWSHHGSTMLGGLGEQRALKYDPK